MRVFFVCVQLSSSSTLPLLLNEPRWKEATRSAPHLPKGEVHARDTGELHDLNMYCRYDRLYRVIMHERGDTANCLTGYEILAPGSRYSCFLDSPIPVTAQNPKTVKSRDESKAKVEQVKHDHLAQEGYVAWRTLLKGESCALHSNTRSSTAKHVRFADRGL